MRTWGFESLKLRLVNYSKQRHLSTRLSMISCLKHVWSFSYRPDPVAKQLIPLIIDLELKIISEWIRSRSHIEYWVEYCPYPSQNINARAAPFLIFYEFIWDQRNPGEDSVKFVFEIKLNHRYWSQTWLSYH